MSTTFRAETEIFKVEATAKEEATAKVKAVTEVETMMRDEVRISVRLIKIIISFDTEMSEPAESCEDNEERA